MDFPEAFHLLIGHEGGYANDPNDPGGETNFGISKRQYPHIDIKNLTLNEARATYHRDYWVPSLAPNFPDPLRFHLFDTAVNSGPRQSIVLLQRALGVKDDGVAGPVTMKAVAEIKSVTALTILFIAQRLRFMAGLDGWDRFGRGWAKRIASNLEEAVK